MYGRFCRQRASPSTRRPHGDVGGPQITAGRFAADPGVPLDASQGPTSRPLEL
jgi:hypothetical protein